MWIFRFLLLCASVAPLHAKLTIHVTKGVVTTIPLAFPGFEGGEEIAQVVANDLNLSGVFQLIPSKGPQSPRDAYLTPDFWPWQSYKSAVMVSGFVQEQGELLTATFRIYDTESQKLLGEASVKNTKSQWRVMAHKISNAIYERLTGEKGFFDTQIVYTAQYGPPTKKIQRIAIIDQDGANGRFLTSDTHKSFTPRCSPVKPFIAFTAFRGFKTLVYTRDLNGSHNEAIPMQGVGISPRFSPDGQNLLFCIADKGAASIYKYDFSRGTVDRMTQTEYSIDVSPSYAPDGKSFVFASDRVGNRPKLYLMHPGEKTPRLLTKGEGSYLAPTWSPDGKWIAFVKRKRGTYYLGIMAPDGSGERMLATDHVIDTPSWAPNSRALVFSAQQRYFGPFSIYLVDLTGRALRKIITSCQGIVHEGNHPDWCKYPRE